MAKIMLVDDHGVVRAGFRYLLEHQAGHVVVEASSAEAAYRNYAAESPDVVVMDLKMPGMGGLEAVRRLCAREKSVRTLVLSMYEDPAFISHAKDAGAMGYVSKRSAPETLTRAIDALLRGDEFFDADIEAAGHGREAGMKLEDLSTREFEIFRLVAEGQSVVAIAGSLHISPKTVSNYRTNIMQKLGLNNSAELTRLAIRSGLVDA